MKKLALRPDDYVVYKDINPRHEIARVLAGTSASDPYKPGHVLLQAIDTGETLAVSESQVVGRADVIEATAALARRPLSLRFRYQVAGEHVQADVFAGSPGATLANSGRIVLRQDEWTTFVLSLQSLGSVLRHFDVSFVEMTGE